MARAHGALSGRVHPCIPLPCSPANNDAAPSVEQGVIFLIFALSLVEAVNLQPPPEAELALLMERERRDLLADTEVALPPDELVALQDEVREVHTSPALLDYVLALVRHTREHAGLRQGLSPRAGLALRRAAQSWALVDGRSGVIPEDVQAVFGAVVGHRLVANTEIESGAPTPDEILDAVAIP